MNTRGFTLIEVIVTMAIISVLAGIIVPISYRVWETGEIDLTRSRMADIKKALVGDPALIQQGVRIDYGFVGDNGELPATLGDLKTDSGIYPNWHGPYLGSGVDPRYFAEDAWGEPLVYIPVSDAFGRRIAARLASKGPDRIEGTADDLDADNAPTEQINPADVTPTNLVAGNISYVISVAEADANPVYYATVTVRYQDIGGETPVDMSECLPLDIGLVQKLVPRSGATRFAGSFPLNLPIGKIAVSSKLFADSSCNGPPLAETADSYFFVAPGPAVILLNPPALYYHLDNGP